MMKTFLITLVLLAFLPPAVSQVTETEASIRTAIDLQAAVLWEKEDFSQLEAVSTNYRNSKARTPSGLWKLTLLYASLSNQVDSSIDDPGWWEFMQARAMRWTERFPASPSAHLQYAQAILRQAWHARGTGFSRTLTPEGSKVFQEKVEEARRYLQKHKTIAARDPYWHQLMRHVATWQGWPESQARPLIEEAVSHEPEFWQAYFSAAEYYSPFWRGDAQKLERFTSWAADRLGGPEGDALYTRIYWWSADRYFKRQFFGSKIDCERMMRGIDRLVQTNPEPWNINRFAGFAVSCGDKKRAKDLFSRIGDNPDLEAWGRSAKTFARFRAWAME